MQGKFSEHLNHEAMVQVIDAFSDLACICIDGKIKYINPAGLVVLGAKDIDALIDSPFQALTTKDLSGVVDDVLTMLADEGKPTPIRIKRLDGHIVSIRIEVKKVPAIAENAVIVLGADITQQIALSEDMLRSEARFKKLVRSSLNMICICDHSGLITYINDAGLKLLSATSADEVTGSPLTDFLHGDYREFIRDDVQALLDSQEQITTRIIDLKGGRVDVNMSFAMLDQGKSFSYKVEIHNITAHNKAVSALRQSVETLERRVEERTRELQEEVQVRRKAEEQMRHMASHDDLTGLPNRAMMIDRLEVAIHRAHRENNMCAVAFIDLDGFKKINDNHGHEAGDTLLCNVAGRLSNCIRETDSVARIGGDEFIIIIADMKDIENAKTVVTQALKAIDEPIILTDSDVTIGASIGVSVYPNDSMDAGELLKLADQAMYKVKGKGKNNFAFVTNSTD